VPKPAEDAALGDVGLIARPVLSDESCLAHAALGDVGTVIGASLHDFSVLLRAAADARYPDAAVRSLIDRRPRKGAAAELLDISRLEAARLDDRRRAVIAILDNARSGFVEVLACRVQQAALLHRGGVAEAGLGNVGLVATDEALFDRRRIAGPSLIDDRTREDRRALLDGRLVVVAGLGNLGAVEDAGLCDVRSQVGAVLRNVGQRGIARL